VRTTVLYGEFELAIDEKNRLLVPAEVRRALDPERDGEAFFITAGTKPS
jgi:DNA-binding transcriptional regulator/RsmH inhibitor MraZ